MADAILFNGAAAFIAQEAGILDLLIKHKGLNPSNIKFVGGLSSGALMTFSFNAAFSPSPVLNWDQFKEQVLFKLTSDKVYTIEGTDPETGNPIYKTEPLRQLLENLTTQVGLKFINDLPFDSAILVTNVYGDLLPAVTTLWPTNIEKVASKLPNPLELLYIYNIAKNIRENQLNITLVSALMCSTAIPKTFPAQNLLYGDPSATIKDGQQNDAVFVDGGFNLAIQRVFAGYKNFFEAYEETFENIYVISPNYTPVATRAVQKINLQRSGSAVETVDPTDKALLFMENLTRGFIKDVRKYNSEAKLAGKIYYCTPEGNFDDALNFNIEREQYDATIAWGESNPDKIAVDITTIPDSELEPLSLD